MNASTTDFKNDFKHMLHQYLGHLSSGENKRNFLTEEFEVRFQPYKQPFFSKCDYDNVISRLMAAGFTCKNPAGVNMLRIQTEIPNKSAGSKLVMSNIRTEISGSDVIQDYCKLNDDLNKLAESPENFNKIKFTLKAPAKSNDAKSNDAKSNESMGSEIKKISNRDFNFNISFNCW